MAIDPVHVGVNQSNLSNFSGTHFFASEQGFSEQGLSGQSVEFWRAAQDLIHPALEVRQSGFEQLTSLGMNSHSPLVAYLLVSRLAEPDLRLRALIVKELSNLLNLPFNGNQAINEVLYYLKTNLSQLSRNQIVSLLQLVEAYPQSYPHVMKIIGNCSQAGDHLADILTDRHAAVSMRQQVACLIGDIGYLCALPTLERLSARLETRRNNGVPGCDRMNGEYDLLPSLKEALNKLQN
jgi:hypothetical protein